MMFCEITTQLTKLTLVQDLAAVMLAAGLIAAMFHCMGWPKVIGYIAAGTLMSMPSLKPFMIADEKSVNVLANLGIIFLMFTLGLELNIRKLRKIGGIVFPTAAVDIFLMLLSGYALGRYVFHWGMLPSLFLGAVVCDSSTTLLAKSLEEMKCAKEHFASVIFGTTITEDILTIGVMAVLTGLAITGTFQAKQLMEQLCYLMLFLVGVMVFGLLFLPRFFNRLDKLKDNETLLVIILGICFGISFVAEKMGFSLALGAFLVGAVVAESSVSKRVHEHTGALRNMFSAVFFVTIGLMVDLGQMWDNKLEILAVTLLVIVGKTLNCAIASFVFGQEHKDAIKTGIGLAQIGDFAYLVALLGMTLGNSAEPYPRMYQIAVGASVITTLVNPFMLKASQPFSKWLDRKMPDKLRQFLENYTVWTHSTGKNVAAASGQSGVKRQLILFVLDLVLIAVVFSVAHYFREQTAIWNEMPSWIKNIRGLLMWLCGCLITFPIMVSAFLHGRKIGTACADAYSQSGLRINWMYHPMRIFTKYIVLGICTGLIVLEFSFVSAVLFNGFAVPLTVLALYAAICIMNWKKIKGFAMEGQKTLDLVLERPEEPEPPQSPQVDLVSVVLPANSGAAGMNLGQLRLRNRTGVTVARIVRKDGTVVPNPGVDNVLQAGDTLFIAATPEQKEKTAELLAKTEIPADGSGLASLLALHVEPIKLKDDSYAVGKSLKELRLRNEAGTTVVRLERKDKSFVDNPGPDDELHSGDAVFVLGNDAQIKSARRILWKGNDTAR